ncbi:adenylate/guanylate cyclase domain-containing protein [Spirochaeta dissipatitropha]
MRRIAFLFCSLWILSSCAADSTVMDISGDWVLYRNQFIQSEVQSTESATGEQVSLNILDSIFRNQLSRYGSLKKSIELEAGRSYSLRVPEIYSASRIWINGVLLRQHGSLGTSVETSSPDYREDVIAFTPGSSRTEIIIEYTNFHYPNRSALGWIYVGDSQRIQAGYIRTLSVDYLVLGSLVVCFVLFLLLYLVNLQNKYNLYMSLFTLCAAVYVFTNSNIYFGRVLFGLDVSYMYRLNNLSSIWIFACILLFFSYLYPIEFNNRKTRFVLHAAAVISATLLLPLPLFNTLRLLFVFKAHIAVSGIIIVYSLVLTRKNKRPLSLLLLIFFFAYWAAMLVEFFLGVPSSMFLLLLISGMFVLVAIKRAETSTAIEEKQELNTRIREVFTQFVPLNILDSLGNSALMDRPPGEYYMQDCTMMLLDIRDFTKMSEGLSAEDNFLMINNFYEIVGYEVDRHKGFIESYGGDGVKAIFPESADDAAACALAISQKVSETSGIKIGMALHYGKVIFGTIGSDDRIQATAVSDVSRILSAIDHFESKMGVEIALTDEVCSRLKLDYTQLFLGRIILKNQTEGIELCQIIPPSFQLDPEFEALFNDGIRFVQARDYSRALDCFQKAHKIRDSHILTSFYIRQLKDHITAGDGLFVLKL